ncbi:hypothetical protein O9929_16285 [Vibrio lentus]|nr:hypothetical protein [Vibrio lentus]
MKGDYKSRQRKRQKPSFVTQSRSPIYFSVTEARSRRKVAACCLSQRGPSNDQPRHLLMLTVPSTEGIMDGMIYH